jgi:hypothetical protein
MKAISALGIIVLLTLCGCGSTIVSGNVSDRGSNGHVSMGVPF